MSRLDRTPAKRNHRRKTQRKQKGIPGIHDIDPESFSESNLFFITQASSGGLQKGVTYNKEVLVEELIRFKLRHCSSRLGSVTESEYYLRRLP